MSEETGPWVIHKRSRAPRHQSYMGPTWDAAGIRHYYRPTFDVRAEAVVFSMLLSEHNPVGFMVSQAP